MVNPFSIGGPSSKYRLHNAPPASFPGGFWHGLIMPITFLMSLGSPKVRIYERKNRGRAYDFGFFLGSWLFSGTVMVALFFLQRAAR